MSEVPQGAGPNLHEIFGIDADQVLEAEHAVQIDRAVEIDLTEEIDQTGEVGSGLGIGTAPENGELENEERAGVTGPSRRGSSSRFLTDVIVDLGLVSRQQVEEAIETSRGTGTMPERVLLDSGALTQDGLTRALAERYGL